MRRNATWLAAAPVCWRDSQRSAARGSSRSTSASASLAWGVLCRAARAHAGQAAHISWRRRFRARLLGIEDTRGVSSVLRGSRLRYSSTICLNADCVLQARVPLEETGIRCQQVHHAVLDRKAGCGNPLEAARGQHNGAFTCDAGSPGSGCAGAQQRMQCMACACCRSHTSGRCAGAACA